ncbi:hypothetical protein QQZ08_002722 [Neonectria magnoliae]|uniref:Uncharacterized protein n=1 Tax=Neonectria magnoliae TaxID=2732573 RepID=A0ABR1IAP9_9HYPO
MVLLIELGQADVNVAQKDGQTPLICVLPRRDRQIVLKLLEYGPNCKAVDRSGNNPLHLAVEYSRGPAIVEALVKAGADPSLKNREGLTPMLLLHKKTHYNSTEIADVLFSAGADVNATDRNGETLFLHWAGRHASEHIQTRSQNADLRGLIQRGAWISVRDIRGRTALHHVVQSPGFGQSDQEQWEERFKFLVGRGLDVNAVDYQGNGLLHELATFDYHHHSVSLQSTTKLWQYLVNKGLEQKNHTGRTPLHLLCAKNITQSSEEISLVDFILSRIKNVDDADNDGITPLHMAVTFGHVATMKLLNAGADPTATTSDDTDASSEPVLGVNAVTFGAEDGPTPLFYACQSGRPETVALLLAAGADVTLGKLCNAIDGFEDEDAFWRSPHQPNSGAVALKLNDTSRHVRSKQERSELPVTTRLEEIVDMLAKYGFDTSQFHNSYALAFREKRDYTARCLKDTWDKNHNEEDKAKSRDTYSALHGLMKEASIRWLKNSKHIDPGTNDKHAFLGFLARRDYYLVEELAYMGMNFLAMPRIHDTSKMPILALRHLLNAGADTSVRNNKGQSPLHVALEADAKSPGLFGSDAVRMLVEAGADVNAVDEAGQSCLGSSQHNIDTMRLLVSHGATVTADALFAAISSKRVGVLKELLAGGFNPNTRRDKLLENETGSKKNRVQSHDLFSLYQAATSMKLPWAPGPSTADEFESRTQLVRLLLAHGADPFATFLHWEGDMTKTTDTPSITVPEGYSEHTILHQVLLHVNRRDAQGRTLLLAACADGPHYVIGSHAQKEEDRIKGETIFKRLISLGADLGARDNFGRNVLHYMLGRGNICLFSEFRKLFAEVHKLKPDLINQADGDGKTPLHYAITRSMVTRSIQLPKLLLTAGANFLAFEKNGDTVLHIIAPNLHILDFCTFFEHLVEEGADVNTRNTKGETPLFALCDVPKKPVIDYRFYGFPGSEPKKLYAEEVIARLKKLGADFFARDNRGRGLLHVAAPKDVQVFEQLMQMGLDVMLEDDGHQTPIDVAIACKNKEILELFEKKD